jgi:predicted phage terminase large subunit-like protein
LKTLQSERQKRSRAKNDLLTYASIIDIPNRQIDIEEDEVEGFTPLPKNFGKHHLLWLKCLQDVEDGKIKRLMGLLPPGSGKALALDTPIPTPQGWKVMGELQVGDQVFDENGNPCNVTWVSQVWADRACYRVFTSCGDEIVADAAHEWLVRIDDEWKLRSTAHISGSKAYVTKDKWIVVTPTISVSTVCIEVDSSSHLFLCGKSQIPTHNSVYTSVCFPTHFMGRFPRKTVILTGYGSDLPQQFGRWARSIVRQPLYKRIFSAELAQESKAVDKWSLTNGSEWRAAGILSGITGNRADGVIWDDLLRGREDADSKTIRDKTWAEYVNSLRTRKKPGAWEVGINTRWHEDDPPGRILPSNYDGRSGWVKGQDGFDWFVVCLPMVCERDDDPIGRHVGDWLWPEWFLPEELWPYQREPRVWSALYQQRPAPETGDFFKREWFKEYGEGTTTPVPHRSTLHIYGASDYAVTDDGGNYTVHVVAGVDPHHNIYILDLWRGRTSSEKWVEVFCDLVKEWRPLGWAEETGQIRAGVGPFINKRLMERHLYIARAQFPTRGDKSVRAQSIRGRMAMGKVYFPLGASWYPEMQRELLTFPAGKNDDQVDALGLLGQVLDKMIQGHPLEDEKDNKPKILSTDPKVCNVTLSDIFEENERDQQKLKTMARRRIY